MFLRAVITTARAICTLYIYVLIRLYAGARRRLLRARVESRRMLLLSFARGCVSFESATDYSLVWCMASRNVVYLMSGQSRRRVYLAVQYQFVSGSRYVLAVAVNASFPTGRSAITGNPLYVTRFIYVLHLDTYHSFDYNLICIIRSINYRLICMHAWASTRVYKELIPARMTRVVMTCV